MITSTALVLLMIPGVGYVSLNSSSDQSNTFVVFSIPVLHDESLLCRYYGSL